MNDRKSNDNKSLESKDLENTDVNKDNLDTGDNEDTTSETETENNENNENNTSETETENNEDNNKNTLFSAIFIIIILLLILVGIWFGYKHYKGDDNLKPFSENNVFQKLNPFTSNNTLEIKDIDGEKSNFVIHFSMRPLNDLVDKYIASNKNDKIIEGNKQEKMATFIYDNYIKGKNFSLFFTGKIPILNDMGKQGNKFFGYYSFVLDSNKNLINIIKNFKSGYDDISKKDPKDLQKEIEKTQNEISLQLDTLDKEISDEKISIDVKKQKLEKFFYLLGKSSKTTFDNFSKMLLPGFLYDTFKEFDSTFKGNSLIFKNYKKDELGGKISKNEKYNLFLKTNDFKEDKTIFSLFIDFDFILNQTVIDEEKEKKVNDIKEKIKKEILESTEIKEVIEKKDIENLFDALFDSKYIGASLDMETNLKGKQNPVFKIFFGGTDKIKSIKYLEKKLNELRASDKLYKDLDKEYIAQLKSQLEHYSIKITDDNFYIILEIDDNMLDNAFRTDQSNNIDNNVINNKKIDKK